MHADRQPQVAHLGSILPPVIESFNHINGGGESADGISIARLRCSEGGHQAVTDELVEGPVMPEYDFRHHSVHLA